MTYLSTAHKYGIPYYQAVYEEFLENNDSLIFPNGLLPKIPTSAMPGNKSSVTEQTMQVAG